MVDGLPACSHALDSIGDHQHRIIGRYGIEGWRHVVGLGESCHPVRVRGSVQGVGCSLGRVPALDRRETDAGENAAVHHAVAAALDDLGHDVKGLLGHLDTRLGDAAIVEGIRVEALDLSQHRRVVGLFRI